MEELGPCHCVQQVPLVATRDPFCLCDESCFEKVGSFNGITRVYIPVIQVLIRNQSLFNRHYIQHFRVRVSRSESCKIVQR